MSWECLESGSRITRKAHKCFFCNDLIPIGTAYDFRSGAGDGIFTMKMHPECNKATSGWTEDEYESFSEGELKRGTNDIK